MTLIIFVLLLVLIVFAIAEVKARRKHESIQTVIHAEVASLKTDVQKLDAKFDGGTIPK